MAAILAAIRLEQRARRQRPIRRERVFRDRTHPLDAFDEENLFRKYRFTHDGCMEIVNLLADRLEHNSRRNHALPADLQVFVALNFFATGAVLDTTATVHGITRSTASRVIHRVAEALCAVKNEVSFSFTCSSTFKKVFPSN